MTPKVINCLKTMFDHSEWDSMKQAGRKFRYTHSHIIKTLAKYTDIKTYTKHSIPDRQEGQKERINPGIDRFYRDFHGKLVILDEESYFMLSHSTFYRHGIYYSSDRDKTPPSFKYRKKGKFEPKVLVWLAASDKGISEPFLSLTALQSTNPSTKRIVSRGD